MKRGNDFLFIAALSPLAVPLCIAVLLLLGCTKKPAPTKPGPAPAKDYGSETAIADVGRGRDLSEMGFQRSKAGFYPVYFALNGVDPLPESIETLGAIAEQAPRFRSCRVTGHACPLGSAIYNQALGYHRAQAVLTRLRSLGVRTGFRVASEGEESPVTEDPAQYALNRRVVVVCQ